jgi:biotin carboxyl carrier protein
MASSAKRFKVTLDGRVYSFEVVRQGDEFRVTVDGVERTVRLSDDNGRLFTIEVEGEDGSRRRMRVAGAAVGEQRHLWVNGRLLRYERARPQRQTTAMGDGSLAASIPAVVSQILVAVGDEVRAGDKLLLLESMKMVIPIQAPYNGRVRHIHCQVGESVAAGVQLLELEER